MRGISSWLLACSVFLSLIISVQVADAQRRRGIPITIESVPAGATVFVDNTDTTPLGTTPLRNVRVPRGSHTFIFQLLNHEEARLEADVRRRRETFRAVLRAMGTIEVSAGNESARGALVSVDGQRVGDGVLGATAIRITNLQPGRHQVRATRDGYRDFEQWVEVGGGQVVRLTAMLERAAPETGSILVGGAAGASVLLDGQPRGNTPTVLEDIAVGPHTVEIRPANGTPYTQQVTVIAGQRLTVTPPTAAGGTVRVIANVPTALISIDGDVIGNSPAVREGLAPGEHIVSATAEGYQPLEQTVTVNGGQHRVVSLQLQEVQAEPGRIMVRANVDDATVFVNGEERGAAPIVLTPEPGPYAIEVRAVGHQDHETTCTVGPGQNCEVSAELAPLRVRVRFAVQATVRNAELVVNEELVGPVPFDGSLPAGSHVIEVRAPGYEAFRQQVLLSPAEGVRPFDITLLEMTDGLTSQQRQERQQSEARRRSAATTHSAEILAVDQATIDLSLGWPYIGELRLAVGILEFLDAGFAIRTFGRLTEFEGRVRAGWRPVEQLSVGGQVRFGGGIGPGLNYYQAAGYNVDGSTSSVPVDQIYETQPNTPGEAAMAPASTYPINTGFLSLEALASLGFGDQGAFTVWLAADFSSDEYAGHPLNSSVYLTHDRDGQNYCAAPTTTTELNCPREDYARARLGGALELVLERHWNIWFLLEGILSAQPRRIYGNLLGIAANDTQFYFRLGTTYKF